MSIPLPFPYVVSDNGQSLDATGVQSNLDALAQASEPGGGTFAGRVFPSYVASPVTTLSVVPHNFGRAPRSIVASVESTLHIGHAYGSSTTVTLFAETRDGSNGSGPVSVNFVAFF